jgi:hypothetical protein
MLGLPPRLDALGVAALALGLLIAAAGAYRLRRRVFVDRIELAAAVTLLVVAAGTPYLVRRVVGDLRTVTAMSQYDRGASGPVQAFLQPYLLDPVRRIIPPNATYATVIGDNEPYQAARLAFPSLALQTLFPRVSVDPAHADWIVAWGTNPGRVAAVEPVVVARRAVGTVPALLVARRRK